MRCELWTRTALVALWTLAPVMAQALTAQALTAQALTAQASTVQHFAAAEQIPVTDVAARRSAFRAAYDAFTEVAPESAEYWSALRAAAQSALFTGLHRDAIQLFAEVAKAGGRDSAMLTFELSALLRGGRGAAAIALARSQNDAHAAGVANWLRGAIRWLPRTSDFARIAALGGARLRAGDPEGLWLLEAQDRAMDGLPGRYFARANLALAFRLLGRDRDAERVYLAAVREAPGEAWLHNDFGLLLKGWGRNDAAAAAYLRAWNAEQSPGSSAAGTNLAVLFLRTGKTRGRVPVVDIATVVRSRPDAAMPRRLLLDLLAARSRPSKGR